MEKHSKSNGRKLSSSDVCARYGIHRRTLGLWMSNSDQGFPQPITINGRLYFDEGEILEYERQAAARGPQTKYNGRKTKAA